ncbi:FAD-binding oxidoreductase [Gordonia sp. ABSL1-1]|uniref:FAD-binding oxidoreductase n=1 Tax=Gordonia sp. ABSL1-1 TaxID=3053923 RepID=UPI00257417D8|nr:FAD-binding oxidoreductase [Gordonia sp. ABSL1-1]MDL9937602.1 FAD-binding oxidoreductase [Gordonia sp. ABSL1-1]
MGAERFDHGVERLLASYRAIPPQATVRLAKKTSNLFRKRAANPHPGLDVSGLDRVISVDPDARTADVAGMCTYENLVAATLPYGLAPKVVPQLKTITLGGAVTGLGIESTSFRNGLPHESVLEVDVLTGDGEILTATPTNEHADLFFGFPNSYGTLGYSVRLRIELETVQPYVELTHLRFTELDELQAAMTDIVDTGRHDGRRVDYLDGVVFTATESYLTLGRQVADAPGGPSSVSDYTEMDIYYRSIQEKKTDVLTTHDYLWRWDTDWFWCSRAFGAQNPRIRRLWPKRYLRSSFYWKLIGLDQRYDIGDRLNARKGLPPGERVVQDIEVPIENTTSYLEWFLENIPIEPIWLCPLRLREPALPGSDPVRPWPLYPLEPGRTYVNVGFWSAVPVTPGQPGHTNKRIETKVAELDGHKSLYSESFYSPEDFDELYGGEHYQLLKKQYDPKGRLLDLYAKAVKQQ